MHLFSGAAPEWTAEDLAQDEKAVTAEHGSPRPADRIAALETAVAELRGEVEALKSRLDRDGR